VGAQGTEVGLVVVAHLQGLTCSSWLGELTSQEQLRAVVVTRIPSSQMSVINSEGNAGGSSGHGGDSDRCRTVTRADTSVTSQERSQPLVSRIRSQRSDIKKEGNTVASSRHKGRSDRCSTPTTARLTCPPWLGEGTLQERPQPAVKSAPTPLSQKSDIKSVGNGHGGGSDRCSKPTRADTAPVARRRNITRTAQTTGRSTYPFVSEELSKLGGKHWWELRSQRWE
jgi:hypothetical protein